MRPRQRESSGSAGAAATLLLAAWLAGLGCSLHAGGLGDDDARPDTGDADVPPNDTDEDVEDGTNPDGPECDDDRDCGDLTCADGWSRCVDHRCVEMAAGECPADEVLCTRNICPGGSNACQQMADRGRCPAGYPCNTELGCVTETRCTSDADCNDSIACSIDRCAPDGLHCIHDPEDADGDTVGGNYDCDGAVCACPGGDCDDGDPTVSPNLPELCGNGRDDDCDGAVDYADSNSACTTLPPHDSCETALPLVLATPQLADDTTDVASREGLYSWCVPDGPFDGPTAYFLLDLTDRTEASRVVLDTKDCGFDTVLSLFAGCAGEELLCNDNRNGDPTSGSRLEYRRLDPAVYVVRVAGRVPDQAGPFVLHYLVEPAGGAADCDNPIDASDGGAFRGRLSDGGIDRGSCVDLATGVGDQERFVVRSTEPVFTLYADATGTPFDHALYLRGSSCSRTVPPDDDLCTEGDASAGALLFQEGWAGVAYLTLDWVPPAFTDGNPDRDYVLLIHP